MKDKQNGLSFVNKYAYLFPLGFIASLLVLVGVMTSFTDPLYVKIVIVVTLAIIAITFLARSPRRQKVKSVE